MDTGLMILSFILGAGAGVGLEAWNNHRAQQKRKKISEEFDTIVEEMRREPKYSIGYDPAHPQGTTLIVEQDGKTFSSIILKTDEPDMHGDEMTFKVLQGLPDAPNIKMVWDADRFPRPKAADEDRFKFWANGDDYYRWLHRNDKPDNS